MELLYLICIASAVFVLGEANSRAQIQLDDTEVIGDYSMISISPDNVLWCESGTTGTSVNWIIPNGVIIQAEDDGVEYALRFNITEDGSRQGLSVVEGSTPLLEGAYQCIAKDAPREGSLSTVNLWINRHSTSPKPELTNSQCSLEGLLPFRDRYVLIGYTEVINGLPTVVNSEFKSSNNILQTIGISRDSIGQGVTAVTVALLVQIDEAPTQIVFHVENNGGSTSFTCVLTDSNLNPVFLSASNIKKTESGDFNITWDHTGDLSQLSHYRVYKKISNDSVQSHYTTDTQISITNDLGNGFELVANENLIIAAFREVDESNGLVVFLPAISNQAKPQCHLFEEYYVQVQMQLLSKNAAIDRDDENVEMEMENFVRNSLSLNEECTVVIESIEIDDDDLPDVTDETGKKRPKERSRSKTTQQSNLEKEKPEKKKMEKKKPEKKKPEKKKPEKKGGKSNKKPKPEKKSKSQKSIKDNTKKSKSKKHDRKCVKRKAFDPKNVDVKIRVACSICETVEMIEDPSVIQQRERIRARRQVPRQRLKRSKKHLKKKYHNQIKKYDTTLGIERIIETAKVVDQTTSNMYCGKEVAPMESICDCPLQCTN